MSKFTPPKAPWLKNYGEVPHTLDYFQGTMFEAVNEAAKLYPNNIAFDFLGNKATFSRTVKEIHRAAKAFSALGIKENDRVTLCLPNAPQTIYCFYALNMIGAVANMIHPLSSEGEIEFYLKDSNSVAAVTLDQFYDKFESVRKNTRLKNLIITGVQDALNPVMKLGYALTEGKKVKKLPKDAPVVMWKEFLAAGDAFKGEYRAERKSTDPAAILYSGGTTGTTKGILLTNLNFNALYKQLEAMGRCLEPGRSMLSVMPMFHGFGLGVCIHAILLAGCKCILVPRFNPQSYAKLLKTKKPNYIAGVPTLYEAILRNPEMDGVDLSCLMGVFSGGDSLSIELKKKLDRFLKEHKATVEVREGYGTTECVTACCLTPYHMSREGSIGLPFPDTFFKIVKVGTEEEVPYGEEGEICLTGPTVMVEYVNQPEETAQTLRRHPDGLTWVHTGDLGTMDEDGFVYFRQRIKRMIVSSGYNIYPSQLENVIDAHEAVQMSCVIGVPDPIKIQKVKAFAMLKPGIECTDEIKKSIMEHCSKHIAKYAMPYDIEIRDTLPKTLVGKVAYRMLEEEEIKAAAARRNA
ncbi:MAG: Long-chain-fatty-acid--CoA ligase [Firmicutes bacterium ADurb.Bin182]|nr:MAG: Long-chain-fatty-acid--CoA ligase [Firmicutes bacterium ADurb.Bin182]